MDTPEIGTLIRKARERKYMGQAELARAAGVAVPTLWTIENGQHRPRPATLRKLAKALDMSVDEMLQGHLL